MLLPELTAATQRGAWHGRAGQRLVTSSRPYGSHHGQREGDAGVPVAWGAAFATFHSLLGRNRDAVAPALSSLSPGGTGLCHSTATMWCVPLGHELLLGKGFPSTASSKHQVLTYALVRERAMVAFIFLFSFFFCGHTIIFLEALA